MITFTPASREFIELVNSELEGSILSDNTLFLEVHNSQQAVGLIQLQRITNICVNIHLHILNEFQNKGYGTKVFYPLLDYVKPFGIKKVMATVPVLNKNMLKVLNLTSLKLCGSIPDGIIYKNNQQDLLIFSAEVI